MTDTKKCAIVTGGGSGIGRAVALSLANAGWQVVVAGRRLDALEQTAAAAATGDIVGIVADVTDGESVDQLFDQTIQRFGRVDLLFNNAGVNAPAKPLDLLTAAELRSVFDINVLGSVLCARAAMRVMKAQTPQGGRIINNGSISAYAPRPNQVAYTASKHAITGLTKSIALDGRAFNIACGQIDIGNAATEMSAYMQAGATQANGSVMPEQRISSDHVGSTIVHMASLPIEANIPFVTVMATTMPLYGRG
ncbi:SDR family oxidoreductase [Devosia sp. 2618]|uniref:SDR family oxidoreductase n=1 Tax=Devosia sp. 2618 TaxID=3156454 RepID=UPI0033919F4C